MFESFGRSWNLVRASARVVRQDKGLMIFPVLSGIAAILVLATFIAPIFIGGAFERLGKSSDGPQAGFYAWLFLLYIALYFVVIFFNSALIGAAMLRLDGREPTVRDGLAIAVSRIGTIFGYAVISATVGVLLNMLEERLGIVGRFVIGLIGAAWSVVTFLVVPVIVMRDVGPLTAVKESAGLLRRTWGENLIGTGTMGIVFGVLIAAVGIVGFGFAYVLFDAREVAAAFILGALTIIALVALGIIQTALSGVFSAALYRYATTGQVPDAFDGDTMRNAFARRG